MDKKPSPLRRARRVDIRLVRYSDLQTYFEFEDVLACGSKVEEGSWEEGKGVYENGYV